MDKVRPETPTTSGEQQDGRREAANVKACAHLKQRHDLARPLIVALHYDVRRVIRRHVRVGDMPDVEALLPVPCLFGQLVVVPTTSIRLRTLENKSYTASSERSLHGSARHVVPVQGQWAQRKQRQVASAAGADADAGEDGGSLLRRGGGQESRKIECFAATRSRNAPK